MRALAIGGLIGTAGCHTVSGLDAFVLSDGAGGGAGGGSVGGGGPGGSDGGAGGSGGAGAGGSQGVCGNGVLETGEECDDGNLADGDRCDASCITVCPDHAQWHKADNHHCYFVSVDAYYSLQVLGICNMFDAHPATAPNLVELGLLTDMLGGNGAAWLGASDLDTEGVFAWITGEPWSYAPQQPPWAPNEPNDDQGEDCVVLLANGQLNDVDCTAQYRALCEVTPAGTF